MMPWALSGRLVVLVIVPVLLACFHRVAHEGSHVFVACDNEVSVLSRAGIMKAGGNMVVVSRGLNGRRCP